MNKKKFSYGWRPDLPDVRDLTYSAKPATLTALPPMVDLRSKCPAVYDQGELGSCTANAIGGAFEFEVLKQGLRDFIPSRLFIYYNERVIENTVNTDAGAEIRDGVKSVNNQGVCSETLWPYKINDFAVKPAASCYQVAQKNTVKNYQRLSQNLDQLKGCLAEGYPFVFGFRVYESFESSQTTNTGVVNMPQPGETPVGGHAVMAVGYDDTQQRFIVRNSWGSVWGQAGYFTMPYGYLTDDNLSNDFWTIRLVDGAAQMLSRI